MLQTKKIRSLILQTLHVTTPSLNYEKSIIPDIIKGLINLALMDSDKWDKTAHAKSLLDQNFTECFLEYDGFFFFFDQILFLLSTG